jgi:hypothetical protein
MIFIETAAFTRSISSLMTDDEYSSLQRLLSKRPDAGPLVKGGGGIRKARWMAAGHGKRGGVRIIYYWAVRRDTLFMLEAYLKSEKQDLTPDEIEFLRRLVKEQFR